MSTLTTGGAPVPPDLVRRVRDHLGCHLLSAFGQTEHSPMISLNPVESTIEQIVETAGQPLPHTAVSIRAPESNTVVPIGEVGEICARSYAVMIRYNDNPKTFSKIDNILELTSRVKSEEIPLAIDKLETKISTSEKEKTYPVDICLASNIIEVGIDIDRLSLLTILGQPKTTSSYISSTLDISNLSIGEL